MKYLDKDGLLYLVQKIKGWLNTKVDKVDGMGLSHNDLTDELKQKILDAGVSSFSGVYTDLVNKPKINGVELKEANSLEELGIQAKGDYQVAGDYATNSDVTTKLAGKVDKVEGKGLSTNDYTTAEKTKLANIAENAQVNTIETVQVNGVALSASNKTVNVVVPTTTSQLTNNSDFATNASVTTKVEAVDGKVTSLATRVGTAETKLTGIEEGAEVNIIETVKVNGEALTVTDKAVDIAVPTKVSQLSNDAGYAKSTDVAEDITEALAPYAKTSEVETKLSGYVTTGTHTTDLNGKVDKVEGKGLSTNDYTTTEKTKLSGIATGAQVNVIEGIKVNGVTQELTNKIADITVPTKVSDLTNDSKFQTESQVSATVSAAVANKVEMGAVNTAISTATKDMATQTWVTTQLANINKKEVVTSIEAMTDTSTIYLMANNKDTNDIYDEYIVLADGKVEKIGTTKVDLTGYVKETDLVAITNAEIDTICA